MAKESTRALTGSRTLTKQFDMASMAYTYPGGVADSYWQPINLLNAPGETTQWQRVTNKAMTFAEEYFDLSGYELDDLTLIPLNVTVQDPGAYMYSGTADVFCIYDLVTNERLTNEDMELIKSNTQLTYASAPGMPRGPLDRDQILFGQYRLFAQNTVVQGLPTLVLPVTSVRFGSGQPTTVQKLWCYRIAVFYQTPANGDTLVIPASTFVLNAEIVKEAELPYMMRLKRSYELSTQG